MHEYTANPRNHRVNLRVFRCPFLNRLKGFLCTSAHTSLPPTAAAAGHATTTGATDTTAPRPCLRAVRPAQGRGAAPAVALPSPKPLQAQDPARTRSPRAEGSSASPSSGVAGAAGTEGAASPGDTEQAVRRLMAAGRGREGVGGPALPPPAGLSALTAQTVHASAGSGRLRAPHRLRAAGEMSGERRARPLGPSLTWLSRFRWWLGHG